jgi:hypothetical protein
MFPSEVAEQLLEESSHLTHGLGPENLQTHVRIILKEMWELKKVSSRLEDETHRMHNRWIILVVRRNCNCTFVPFISISAEDEWRRGGGHRLYCLLTRLHCVTVWHSKMADSISTS